MHICVAMVLGMLWSLSAQAADGNHQPHLSRAGSAAGSRLMQPQRWGLLGAEVTNPTLQPVERQVVTSLDADRFTQFSTSVWLPPRSRRSVLQLLRLGEVDASARGQAITTMLIDASSGRESMQPPQAGLLAVDDKRPVTVVVGDPEDERVYDMLFAAAAGNGRVTSMAWTSLPPLARGLDSLDVLVLAQRDLRLSATQSEAIRQWTLGGGTLWIMLDACDPQLGPSLMSGDWPIQEVDRVAVTSIQIQSDRDQEQWQGDEPATLVRVLVNRGQVLCRSGAWPLALQHPVGRGRLMVSMLGAGAWMREDRVGAAMDTLSGQAMRLAAPARVDNALLSQLVHEQIGYQIMSRRPVLIALVLLACVISVGGLWLMRAGRLEQMAWLSPSLALLTLLVVLGLGYLHRREVPQTLSALQVMEVSPQQGRAVLSGVVGLYAAGAGPLQAQTSAPPWPQPMMGIAKTQRLLLSDIDRWSWQQLDLPQAVRVADLSQVVRLGAPVYAEVSFNENGVEGRWHGGDLGPLQDAVLGSSAGMLAPSFAQDQSFVAGAARRLPVGRFIDGAMTAIRARRQAVYLALTTPQQNRYDASYFPSDLAMMGWLPTVPSGLSVADQDVVHRDETLVIAPLVLRRPSPGSMVSIPGAMIPFEAVRGADGATSSVMFDNLRRRWLGQMNSGQSATLAFQLPPVVLPLRPSAATLAVEVRAPGRWLKVFAGGDHAQPLAQAQNPDGELLLPLQNAQSLPIDERGRILLEVQITDPEALDQSPTWEIMSLQLNVQGQVQ